MTDQPKIRVTATDLETGESDTHEIWDDYCLVSAGSADVTSVATYAKSDGTTTHVITVKGVRRG